MMSGHESDEAFDREDETRGRNRMVFVESGLMDVDLPVRLRIGTGIDFPSGKMTKLVIR
jgi:hypothetical protein